jgi:hypothetical protein
MGDTDWIDVARGRDRWRAVVNAVMNLRFPLNAGNFLTSCGSVSFSERSLLHEVIKLVSELVSQSRRQPFLLFSRDYIMLRLRNHQVPKI